MTLPDTVESAVDTGGIMGAVKLSSFGGLFCPAAEAREKYRELARKGLVASRGDRR